MSFSNSPFLCHQLTLEQFLEAVRRDRVPPDLEAHLEECYVCQERWRHWQKVYSTLEMALTPPPFTPAEAAWIHQLYRRQLISSPPSSAFRQIVPAVYGALAACLVWLFALLFCEHHTSSPLSPSLPSLASQKLTLPLKKRVFRQPHVGQPRLAKKSLVPPKHSQKRPVVPHLSPSQRQSKEVTITFQKGKPSYSKEQTRPVKETPQRTPRVARRPSSPSPPKKVVLASSSPQKQKSFPFPLRGDLNRNGRIDVGDALLLAKLLVQLQQKTLSKNQEKWLAVADVNRDGQISVADSIYLTQHLLKKKRP